MEKMEIFSVKMCWGNFAFDYVHSDSVGANSVQIRFIVKSGLEEIPYSLELKLPVDESIAMRNIDEKIEKYLNRRFEIGNKARETFGLNGNVLASKRKVDLGVSSLYAGIEAIHGEDEEQMGKQVKSAFLRRIGGHVHEINVFDDSRLATKLTPIQFGLFFSVEKTPGVDDKGKITGIESMDNLEK
ncbi:hypothetical protein Tco_1318774 [Tanacetum coccineum]